MIWSVTLGSLYAPVSHLCLTGLPEVAMPHSDMRQDCRITFPHTRPCYAKSSYRSVDPQTVRGNVHQVDHVPNGPSNSTAITTVFPLRLCEASYWSRSLESDATVRADYALTTTTSHICNEMIDRPIARLGVARPGVRECYLAILPHVGIWHCDLW